MLPKQWILLGEPSPKDLLGSGETAALIIYNKT